MFFPKICPKSALFFLSWIILLFPAASPLPGQRNGDGTSISNSAPLSNSTTFSETATLSETTTLSETASLSDSSTLSDSAANHVDSLQNVRIDGLERRWSRRVQQLGQAHREAVRRVDSLTTLLNGLRIRYLELEETSRFQTGRIDDLNAEARQQQERIEEYRSRLHARLWAAGSILLALLITAFLFQLLRSERTRLLLARLKTEFKSHRKEQRRELNSQHEQQLQEIKKVRREQRRRYRQQYKKQRKEQRRELMAFRKKQRRELKDMVKKK